ncbi:uncharacterized protein METZ01_LOCUS140577, partial [marine metagenome]
LLRHVRPVPDRHADLPRRGVRPRPDPARPRRRRSGHHLHDLGPPGGQRPPPVLRRPTGAGRHRRVRPHLPPHGDRPTVASRGRSRRLRTRRGPHDPDAPGPRRRMGARTCPGCRDGDVDRGAAPGPDLRPPRRRIRPRALVGPGRLLPRRVRGVRPCRNRCRQPGDRDRL